MSEDTRIYETSRKFISSYILLAILVFIMAIMTFSIIIGIILFILGIIFLGIVYYYKNKSPIIVTENNINFIQSPLKGMLQIDFKNIIDLDIRSKRNIFIFHKGENDLIKKNRLPLFLLSENDQKEVVDQIETKISSKT